MKKKILLLIFGMFILVAGMVSFFALDLTPSLVSYYSLQETSGDVIDSHGTNDGTNNGATRGVTGKINNAFDFDGTNDYVDTNKDFTTGDYSFSIWVNPDTFADGDAPIGDRADPDGTGSDG